ESEELKGAFMQTLRTSQRDLVLKRLSRLVIQQIHTNARWNEYQPKKLKRKRTHGWIKRIRTPSGIEVIPRHMLKGKKSLSH
uniref:Large ribosomal subunit protein bL34m n=1 Tax=Chelydra serpentina TaxID=8475 RepID=A0A8C3T691_CHESE